MIQEIAKYDEVVKVFKNWLESTTSLTIDRFINVSKTNLASALIGYWNADVLSLTSSNSSTCFNKPSLSSDA
ncbi:hypothetical protein ACTPD5_22870, partial [Clostridioides difficile]|uniref:hypothetical protein n=1 Tax=Clostridioides difficile TaxID=1496 RepID=UPI003F8D83EA